MLPPPPTYLKRSERDGSGSREECHQQCSGRRRSRFQADIFISEREEIALLRAQGCTDTRDGPSDRTCSVHGLSRVASNAATRSGGMTYRATTAQWHAERSACRPKQAKLMWNKALHSYVQDRLSGIIMTSNGFRLPARPYHGTDEGTVGGSIAAGRAPGALSRSPVDCRSSFQMT